MEFTVLTKFCPKCSTEKPITEFYRDKSRGDGREGYCKLCSAIRKEHYYEEHRDEILLQVDVKNDFR